MIPIIDVFAGPGGLGEGFSSFQSKRNYHFDIRLSIEKDVNAIDTLFLRSFYRHFRSSKIPDKYYSILSSDNLRHREVEKDELYNSYRDVYDKVKEEVWQLELGSKEHSNNQLDEKIRTAIKDYGNWVLIGGPPCQAFSLVGRSRVGGIRKNDTRVDLYKHYLRIIAKHKPAVFIMENVKGLLSAKVENKNVFNKMLLDLQKPSRIFKKYSSPNYKIYSLSTKPQNNLLNELSYQSNKDFLIKSELYGIPQKRHRVILIGIREDIKKQPPILMKKSIPVTVADVIADLPKIRSGLNRKLLNTEITNGKPSYQKLIDNDHNWEKYINQFLNGVTKKYGKQYKNGYVKIVSPKNSKGNEFIKADSPHKSNPLFKWYRDKNLKGVCNHESRSHLLNDIERYLFATLYSHTHKRNVNLRQITSKYKELIPRHRNAASGKFVDRFKVQLADEPSATITSHISKDGHYYIHYDPEQCRTLTVREAARIQTFPDNYLFCGSRTAQYHQVGNAVPPLLAYQIAEIVYQVLND